MLAVQERLKLEKQFASIADKLQGLLNFNLNTQIIKELILLCTTYNQLSLEEIQQSETTLTNVLTVIKQNTDLPIEYKKQLLTVITKLKKLVNTLTVNTIIDLI